MMGTRDETREMRARAAELIEYLQRVVGSTTDDSLYLTGNGWYTDEWLTAVVAAHDSYYGHGKARCGATWATGNSNHPEGAVCAREAVDYWEAGRPRAPHLYPRDVELCQHHQERLEDDARGFVRDLDEWRAGGRERSEQIHAQWQASEAARAARQEKLHATMTSAQGASKGKRHAVMPDGTTACGVAPVHHGGRWLDQPEDERCRACAGRWHYHRTVLYDIDGEESRSSM